MIICKRAENDRVIEKYWSSAERVIIMSPCPDSLSPHPPGTQGTQGQCHQSRCIHHPGCWQPHYGLWTLWRLWRPVRRASCCRPRLGSAAQNSIKDQIQLLYFYGYWNWFLFIFKFIRFQLHTDSHKWNLHFRSRVHHHLCSQMAQKPRE